MGVFLPLSKESIEEVKSRMLPYHNLLKPADGSPIVLPNKEMALGIYYLTTLDNTFVAKKDEELRSYGTTDQAISAYQLERITLRQPIITMIGGQMMRTSVGRVMVNQLLPVELQFINEDMKASDVKNIIVEASKLYEENSKVGELIDKLKEIGFWGATIASGLSVSVFDCETTPDKDQIVHETEIEVAKLQASYAQGLLTADERRDRKSVV